MTDLNNEYDLNSQKVVSPFKINKLKDYGKQGAHGKEKDPSKPKTQKTLKIKT